MLSQTKKLFALRPWKKSEEEENDIKNRSKDEIEIQNE
jgi:hypothetical protein